MLVSLLLAKVRFDREAVARVVASVLCHGIAAIHVLLEALLKCVGSSDGVLDPLLTSFLGFPSVSFTNLNLEKGDETPYGKLNYDAEY